MKKFPQVAVIVRDGWGIGKPAAHNAVSNARTPNTASYLAKHPHAVLDASGEAVGLPEGFQGSSEVGHLNMGAGRIVKQELARINDALVGGTFFGNENYLNVIAACRKGGALHLMGLVQDEGVHAHQAHLFAIMKDAKAKGVSTVYIHFFSDGRDTPPRSSLSFLYELQDRIKEYGIGKVGTLMGRYYAMDRSKNWELTSVAYDSMVNAEGRKVATAEEAIKYSYEHDRTPDKEEMFDEYIPPTVIGDYPGIKDGDGVIHFNYRQDRAIQLTRAFIDEKEYPGKRKRFARVAYAGLTKYYDSFPYNILGSMDSEGGMENLLGEVLCRAGLPQLRISETQKFRHVTSFFNGKSLKPYTGEKQVEIKGAFDPALFAEHPEMNARDIVEAAIKEMKSEKYAFILVNFANGDMVGHTGNFEAARKGIEVVDECVGKLVDQVLANDGVALITADHGNAEEMLDEKTGLAKTAHTKNPVELMLVAKDTSGIKLREHGILADIAPTVLDLLGLEIPKEMTAKSMIAK